MELFETTPKSWGNSLGITIPKEIVEKEGISSKKKLKVLVLGTEMEKLKQAFGSLKLKKSTQQAMDEIDQHYD